MRGPANSCKCASEVHLKILTANFLNGWRLNAKQAEYGDAVSSIICLVAAAARPERIISPVQQGRLRT
jgi:hypothetical protein